MRVLVTGAAGMLGTRLVARLRDEGLGSGPISDLVLADTTEPDGPVDATTMIGDVGDPDYVDLLASTEPDLIFHLAAVVSSAAEADVELGYDVNVHGLWHLLEAARVSPEWRPRLVMASSVAVFADADAAPLASSHRASPVSSYGTQKAIGELLVADYTRRGAIDGIAIRLPTVVVRSGPPNAAASTFLSTIIRAPLAGQQTTIPVSREQRAWIASPDAAVGQLLHAARLDRGAFASERALTMPGLSVSVDELVRAVELRGGAGTASLLVDEPDPAIEAIVGTWPASFDVDAAVALGFSADTDVMSIIDQHLAELDDDLDDDVTAMSFDRHAATTPVQRTGAPEPMTNYDDAAASVLAKVRDFIGTLEDEERQVFAAMLAPAVTEAWEGDEVAGFDTWTPNRVQDHLNQAIRNGRFHIDRTDPENLA